MIQRLLFCSAAAVLLLIASASAQTTYQYDTKKQKPFELKLPLPDGNYKVTVQLGSAKSEARTFIKAESRRLYGYDIQTRKGEIKTISFVVNKRDALIREGGIVADKVKLKPRELGKLNWDDFLSIEIGGEKPAVSQIRIEPADTTTTVFLCGDSTVVDQDNEPWASWGQMAPWFFDESIAIANYAESGERTDSFIGAGRLKKILSLLKEGDYVFVEFGHNDQKIDSRIGGGAYYFFAHQLKIFIDSVRAKGGIPVLVSPTCRRSFDLEGRIQATHLDYPAATQWVAEREKVAFIDLQKMSAAFYEALGEEGSKAAFVHYKAGSFPGMPKDVADNTHFNSYGAFQLAKCVVSAIAASELKLKAHIINFSGFDPSYPDSPASFHWFDSPWRELSPQVLEKHDQASEN